MPRRLTPAWSNAFAAIAIGLIVTYVLTPFFRVSPTGNYFSQRSGAQPQKFQDSRPRRARRALVRRKVSRLFDRDTFVASFGIPGCSVDQAESPALRKSSSRYR